MRALTSAVLLAAMLAGGGALAQSAKQSLNEHDRTFATKAMGDGMLEVQLGALAKEQGGSDAVKQFGQRMVDEHGKANRQLETIAGQRGLTAPSDLPAEDKQKLDQLSKLRGEEFDSAYIPMMVQEHQQDLDDFRKQARQGTDADLKAFAQQNTPILEQHLRTAREIQASQNVAATPKKK